MSKINTTFGLLSRTGLVLSSAIVLCVSVAAIEAASAQELRIKFDGKEIELKRNSGGSNNSGDGVVKKKAPPRIISANTKGDRDEGGNGKKVFPQIAIGKGDTEEGGSNKKRFPRIAIGKGDRDEDKPKSQQIVIGKGDQAEDNEPPKKRQVIVEPKPKPKLKKKVVVTEAAPKKLKTLALLTEPAAPKKAKKIVVADAAPAEEGTSEVETETPAEEAPAADAPAEETTGQDAQAETPVTPEQKFEVGQIVTGGDGKSYVIVKIDDTGISAMPLSAFAEYEQPKKVYKKKRKKRYSGYGYSSSRSYGGSSCH